jgi:hypothetical protein
MEFTFLIKPEEIALVEARLPPEQQVSWPLDSLVMYAVDGDKIIGRMGVMSIKILEGTWVAPGAPPSTAFRLMTQMLGILPQLGNTHALALAYDETPKIGEYLTRLKFERFPVTLYSKELDCAKREEAA